LSLGEKGANINFNNDRAIVNLPDGTRIMIVVHLGRLYTIDVQGKSPTVLVTQSKHGPASFDIWHQRLVHAGENTIREMKTKDLVDSMNTHSDLSMKGRCEDCIYGKHTTHPFNKTGAREQETLKRVHIDIWGPAQT